MAIGAHGPPSLLRSGSRVAVVGIPLTLWAQCKGAEAGSSNSSGSDDALLDCRSAAGYAKKRMLDHPKVFKNRPNSLLEGFKSRRSHVVSLYSLLTVVLSVAVHGC